MKLIYGAKYNKLTIIDERDKARYRDKIKVKCNCGNIHTVILSSLLRGTTKSCGKCKKVCGIGTMDLSLTTEDTRTKSLRSREYSLWFRMLNRCVNNKKYPSYVGCKICPRWLVFSNFAEDIKHLPNYDLWLDSDNHMQLDKDILGQYHAYYSPNYCMFATPSQNTKERNKRVGHPFANTNVIAKHVKVQAVPIIATNVKTLKKMRYETIRECARALNCPHSNIIRCLNGKRKTCKGMTFDYANRARNTYEYVANLDLSQYGIPDYGEENN